MTLILFIKFHTFGLTQIHTLQICGRLDFILLDY